MPKQFQIKRPLVKKSNKLLDRGIKSTAVAESNLEKILFEGSKKAGKIKRMLKELDSLKIKYDNAKGSAKEKYRIRYNDMALKVNCSISEQVTFTDVMNIRRDTGLLKDIITELNDLEDIDTLEEEEPLEIL